MEDVLITITGSRAGSDIEEVKEEYKGEHASRNGIHYFFYDEYADGKAINKISVKAGNGIFELKKKGEQSLSFILEKGRIHKTNYVTPYGTFSLEFRTSEVDIKEMPGHMEIYVEYELYMDGEPEYTTRLTYSAGYGQT